MKTTALFLAFVATSAIAGTENMVAQCEAVMRCDVCRIEKDERPRPNGVLVPIKDGSLRRISQADYNYIRNAGDAKRRDGRYLMCYRVEQAMKKPDSGRGLAARALFNADWQEQKYCP
jgi:hypothetical protein